MRPRISNEDREQSKTRGERSAGRAAYLAWLLLLLPIVPLHALHAVNAAKGEAAELETEILVAAKDAGVQAPAPPQAPKSSVLIKAAGVAIASALVALAVIGAEFALRAVF